MTRTTLQVLGTAIAELTGADRSDGQLLEAFVRHRDQEAFAAVVRRHGPMVLGVCRRVLRNAADADDAFQASFLVLARKAAALGSREKLAGWLHGVAFNTARRVLRSKLRRATHEQAVGDVPEPPAAGGSEVPAELLAILDEELDRLPERYRLPVVLCDLQGATRSEAARVLKCPEGTVAGRLARARAMLAARLTGRGVLPAVGVLAGVLAERVGASPALVTDAVRVAAGGIAAERITQATEGVVNAMFVKQLQKVAVIAVCCVAGLAGGLGLLRVSAAAQPGSSPAKGTGDPQPATKPAGKKVAVVVPLKKLDAKGTAEILERLFPKSVTVAAVRDENALIVYATEAETGEVYKTLGKLGETIATPPAPAAATEPKVFPLKHGNASVVARQLTEIFNGPKGLGPPPSERLRITSDANTNSVIVQGSPADLLTVQMLLQDFLHTPGGAPKAAPEKIVSVNFQNTPWEDVLKWFANESGLTPIYTVKPVGNVTLQPPKDRKFTIGEVVDLLNEAMMQQKFLLIRRQVSFTILPADEKIDGSTFPTELADLPTRGKTELVQVLIPLKTLKAEDTAAEVRKLLTPFGTVAGLPKTNALVLVDTAGNVRRIAEVLQKSEDAVKPPALNERNFNLDPRFDPRGGVNPQSDPRGGYPAMPEVKPDAPKLEGGVNPGTHLLGLGKVPWADVLEWFAKESGLTPIYTRAPTGNVTLRPPKDRRFTTGEVIDLLNEAMMQQKLILVRRQVTFTILPADERIDPTQIPRIEMPELASRGTTELVQVLVPLKTLSGEDTAPEVQKMLTPFGSVATLRNGTLVLLDTAGNIRRIVEILKKCEEAGKSDPLKEQPNFGLRVAPLPDPGGGGPAMPGLKPGDDADQLTHKFLYIRAKDAAERLKTLLPAGGEAKAATVTVDEKTNSVTITGPPEKITLAKQIIEQIDTAARPGYSPSDKELRKYPVAAGTADAVAKKLQENNPSLRVVALPQTNEILVLATPEEHFELSWPGDRLAKPGETKTVIHELRRVKAADAVEWLKALLPASATPGQALVVEVNTGTNSVIMKGTEAQIEQAKKVIEQLDVNPFAHPALPPGTVLRKYSVPAGTADAAAKALAADQPKTRVVAFTATDELLVLATETEHTLVAQKLKDLQADAAKPKKE